MPIVHHSRLLPRLTIIVSLLLAATPSRVPAADKPAEQPRELFKPAPAAAGGVATQVYDVRDLLVAIKDYPFTGTMAGDETGLSATKPVSPRVKKTDEPEETASEQIVRLVRETVAPDTWRDNGGPVGAIREINGMLIITQTRANHVLLASLLAQLRETSAKMVRIRAHWLILQPDEVETLYKPQADDKAAAGAAKPGSVFREIDRAALERAGGKAGHFRAETVCFNGQTVHITSGRSRKVITDLSPSVGQNAAAFDPSTQTIRSGLVLQFTPVLNPDRPTATLDLLSTYSEADSPAGKTSSSPAAAAKPATRPNRLAVAESHVLGEEWSIDSNPALSQDLRTTISIPLGRPVLVGGMTLNANAKGEDATHLYLVVELLASE